MFKNINSILISTRNTPTTPKVDINDGVVSRIQNKNPNTDRDIFTSRNPYGGTGDAGTWVRSSSCWLNGLSNISCFSPAQRSGANWWQRGGTLITRKHVLFAKHFMPTILTNGGTPIIFVDEENNAVKRNLIQIITDPFSDIAIGLLDQEASSNIKTAKVLPRSANIIDSDIHEKSTIYGPIPRRLMDFTNFLDGNYHGPPDRDQFTLVPLLYAVGVNQNQQSFLRLLTSLSTRIENGSRNGFVSVSDYIGIANASWIYPYKTPLNPNSITYSVDSTWPKDHPSNFLDWFPLGVTTGYSGQPIFLIINNEIVILGLWWVPSGGPFVTWRYDLINLMIENLSPGEDYSLTSITKV